HAIWGTGAATTLADCKKLDGTSCNAPACGSVTGTSAYCSATAEQRSPGHDTFSLWPDTSGCVAPPEWTDVTQPKPIILPGVWHRACDEREWLRSQLRTDLLDDEKGLLDVRLRINFNVTTNSAYDSKKPTLFDGDTNAQQFAWDSMVGEERQLDFAAKSGPPLGSPGSDPNQYVNAAVTQLTDYYETLPASNTPFGTGQIRPQCRQALANPKPGFICAGTLYDDSTDLCKRFVQPATAAGTPQPPLTDEQSFPCWDFWNFNPDNGLESQMQKRRVDGPLPSNYPTDWRKTQGYAADVSGSKALGAWKAYQLVPHSSGNIADNQADVNEAFIMLNQVNPTDAEKMLRAVAGESPPTQHWTITGSKAIIHRADSAKDAVHAASLCNSFANHDNSKLLGFIPKSAYGWCKVLLGAFDVFLAIYTAIHDFFYDNMINPLRAFSIDLPIIGTICPFCWLADIIEGFVNFVLGPAPPDTRTYHIALVTVGCVPAVQEVADVANNFDLAKILKMVIAGNVSLSDPANSTCGAAPSS
ncbi:MAG TPA: hypothetical protein VIN56_02610, partial [Candidatus Dormibacteraeota bacterium]